MPALTALTLRHLRRLSCLALRQCLRQHSGLGIAADCDLHRQGPLPCCLTMLGTLRLMPIQTQCWHDSSCLLKALRGHLWLL